MAAAVLLVLTFWTLVHATPIQAEDPSSSFGSPEGSSSIIESRTWRVAASDLVALREQTKVAVGQIPEAVLVKETASLLSISLPTKQLPTLRQALDKLGSVNTSEDDPSAPTTLLRLMFVQP